MKWLTPEQFAVALERKAQALQRELRAGMDDALTETKNEAQKGSSGTLTTGQLREMGHPYATRDPQTPLDPSIINVQTGEFRRAWKKNGPRQRGVGFSGEVVNTSKVAPYMLGTRKMVPRRLDTAVANGMRPKFRSRMQGALRKGLRA